MAMLTSRNLLLNATKILEVTHAQRMGAGLSSWRQITYLDQFHLVLCPDRLSEICMNCRTMSATEGCHCQNRQEEIVTAPEQNVNIPLRTNT